MASWSRLLATVTVYNSAGRLVRTIPDGVKLSQFGFPGHPGITRSAPVETAFASDGKYAYVSNYSMNGSRFGPEGFDTCTPSSALAAGDTDSYVYRIDTKTLAIDQVIQVRLVPKYVATMLRSPQTSRFSRAWPLESILSA